MSGRRPRATIVLVLALLLLIWLWVRPGAPIQVIVPTGATLSEVADSLAARGVIRGRLLFELYARARRADRKTHSDHGVHFVCKFGLG